MSHFFPDYTPKPQPNMSTTPVDTSVVKAGVRVSTEEVRDQIEQTLHVVSQKGGHSAVKGVGGANKLAAYPHHHHHASATADVIPPIDDAKVAAAYPELTPEEIASTHEPEPEEKPLYTRRKKKSDE